MNYQRQKHKQPRRLLYPHTQHQQQQQKQPQLLQQQQEHQNQNQQLDHHSHHQHYYQHYQRRFEKNQRAQKQNQNQNQNQFTCQLRRHQYQHQHRHQQHKQQQHLQHQNQTQTRTQEEKYHRKQHNQHHHSYKNQYHFWCLLHVILCLIDITSSLTMTEVKIPNHIMRSKSAVLGCRYSLDGESLYSVKWYKDGHEFYRYVPRDKPPGQVFPLPGVAVDLRNSTDTQVIVRRVNLVSSGLYRCEVSGEAPAFNTVSESGTMTVVVTPIHGPKISGGQPRYQIGDVVRVNCSSAASKPICHLSWLINGEPANRSYLKQYDKLIVGREGLEVARLGLEFRVRGYHFKHGDMKLKCVAKISSLYWQSNEESVESDRQHRAPVLESRDSVAAKSHAHGTSAANSYLTTAMHIIYVATLMHLTLAFISCRTLRLSTR